MSAEKLVLKLQSDGESFVDQIKEYQHGHFGARRIQAARDIVHRSNTEIFKQTINGDISKDEIEIIYRNHLAFGHVVAQNAFIEITLIQGSCVRVLSKTGGLYKNLGALYKRFSKIVPDGDKLFDKYERRIHEVNT